MTLCNCFFLLCLAAVSNFLFKREMDEIKRSLNSIKITNNKIFNYVCPIVETVQSNDDGRGMPALPVDSFDNLVLWENFLKDHDNSIHVVRSILVSISKFYYHLETC